MANTSTHSTDRTDANCGICLEAFEERTTAQDCGHAFCYECISRWMDQRNRCPICRGRIRALRYMVEQVVHIPAHAQPHVRYIGPYTIVQTPLDSPIYALEPVQMPDTLIYRYMKLRLEQDTAYQLKLHPNTIFVLPEDLPLVEATLEAAGITQLESLNSLHLPGRSSFRHGAFLELHLAHNLMRNERNHS